MTDHLWQDNPDGTITCTLCGLTRGLAFGQKPRGNCPKAQNQPIPPALWQKALNFAAAVVGQAPLMAEAFLTGDEAKAFRSQDEIKAIAETCKACPLFDGERCTHKGCGCTINADRMAWISKLAWRSQRCPDNPPRWT